MFLLGVEGWVLSSLCGWVSIYSRPSVGVTHKFAAFHSYYDASHVRFGTVLAKSGREIAYMSRLLKPYERNYLVHDLEFGICSDRGKAFGYESSWDMEL